MRKRVNELARHNTENEDETATHINIGSRVSCHDLWDQCEPGVSILHAGWPEEITIFLDKFCRADGAERVEVINVSKAGKHQSSALVEPANYVATEQTVMSLLPNKNHLLFHPVPFVGDKKLKTVRMGWATVLDVHPLRLFPEPVVFWNIGPNAFQGLIPWYSEKTVKESCRDIEMMGAEIDGATVYSTPKDMLFLPGSLIFCGKHKSMTASVLYDAFTATTFENFDEHRSDY